MRTKEGLIILGTGGTSVDIADLAEQTGQFLPIGFLADGVPQGMMVNGLRVLGGLEEASLFDDVLFVNGIGSSQSHRAKERIIGKTGIPDDRFATIIHPTSGEGVISPSAEIGKGVVVFPYTTIRSNVTVGNHTLVLSHGSIGHDAKVGPYGSIASGVRIAGGAEIGRAVYLGSGSMIKEDTKVGDEALVGMGSVVLSDVAPRTRVVGNPARVIRH